MTTNHDLFLLRDFIMFDFLRRPKDPTQDWRRADNLQLTFDLQTASLNSIGLGQRIERLSFLGPVEDRSALRQLVYDYYSLGLAIEHDEQGTIRSFTILSRDPDDPKYQPFPGVLLCRGENLAIEQLTEDFFLSRFGEPYCRDEDEDEVLLFHEFPNLEWQVECNLDGTLKRILLTDEPLMAEDRVRKDYAVTRPWPPRWTALPPPPRREPGL